jgi:adenylate kinase family enzyme
MKFPLFKTKIEGVNKKFDLADPVQRQEYFQLKAGEEIKKIAKFLEKNTFVAYLIGKKNSGKGTYAKLFMEAVGSKNLAHLSIGDVVRNVHQLLEDSSKRKEILDFLRGIYRGFLPFEEAIDALLSRSTVKLLPTELILALTKWQINQMERKAIFIDGFPRDLDQISYSLYFRDLIGYREDPDFFVFIEVPEAVIDERMKYRVVCPVCGTPRNLKLLITKEIGYDRGKKEFYLICENKDCRGAKMVAKEGDSLGIEAIRNRLEVDDKVMKQLLELKGVGQVFLRNSVPVALAKDYVDDYEITPEYLFEWDKVKEKVRVIERPWQVKDDEGVLSYSLLPAPVAVSLIKQTAKVLGL